MPDNIWAFSVRKSIPWRGLQQGFSNLYHYEVDAPSVGNLDNILTALKALEAPVHATDVTFIEGRAWGPVNAQGRGGDMTSIVAFSGAGTATPDTTFYKECAYLIKWPLGRYGSRNRPQWLRKWIHSHSVLGQSSTMKDGSTSLGAIFAPLSTYATGVRVLTPTGGGTTYDLTSASGHVPISAAQLHAYLEHHQFGR